MLITTDPTLYNQQLLYAHFPFPGHNPSWPTVMVFDPPDALSGSRADLLASIHAGILTVQQTATLLSCSVDSLRRLPMEELPTYDGPGRGTMYMMDDIKHYLTRNKRDEKRGSGLGHSASHPRPQPQSGILNQAEIALRKLKKGVL